MNHLSHALVSVVYISSTSQAHLSCVHIIIICQVLTADDEGRTCFAKAILLGKRFPHNRTGGHETRLSRTCWSRQKAEPAGKVRWRTTRSADLHCLCMELGLHETGTHWKRNCCSSDCAKVCTVESTNSPIRDLNLEAAWQPHGRNPRTLDLQYGPWTGS